jgi:hypothetical protein
MMTKQERLFLDLYYREDLLREDGHAHQEAAKRGITYDHCAALWNPYKGARAAEGLGPWEDTYPEIPEDSNLPCPWESREDLEARIKELTKIEVVIKSG